MFLPVILMRNYGIGAWFVFAIPNVLGAAAMGWVLCRPGASEKIIADHRWICTAFSAVTLAFQAYFLVWLSSVPGTPLIAPRWSITAVALGTVCGLFQRSKIRWDFLLAWIALAVTTAVLVKGFMHFSIGDRRGQFDDHAALAIASLAPVCGLGFLLCPYLDVTFHRARQAISATEAKAAFGIGFGIFFLAAIFLTMLYEGDFYDHDWIDHFGSFGAVGLVTWVAAHMAVQIGFTWSAHLRAVPTPKSRDIFIWLTAAAMLALAWFFLHQQQWFDLTHQQMLTGEAIYRIFMGFYGLVFPTYVWLFIVPLKGFTPSINRRSLLIAAAAVIFALPCFWQGFIAGKMLWLWPGVAIVLASRLMLKPANPTKSAT